MKKLLKKIYDFFHICEIGDLHSIQREISGNYTRIIEAYYCKGLFCDKKIKRIFFIK